MAIIVHFMIQEPIVLRDSLGQLKFQDGCHFPRWPPESHAVRFSFYNGTPLSDLNDLCVIIVFLLCQEEKYQ